MPKVAKKTTTKETKVTATKKKAVKKVENKAEKKVEKKAEKKKAPAKKKVANKAASNGKPELSKPQGRILKVLSKGKPLTRKQISEKAPVDNAMCSLYIGSVDPEISKRKSHAGSLLNRKFVKVVPHGDGTKSAFQITLAGKKAAAKV